MEPAPRGVAARADAVLAVRFDRPLRRSDDASDLGDVDGDGDLDWMTSSFDGEWRLLENRDRRLDLALIDEQADDVLLMTGT